LRIAAPTRCIVDTHPDTLIDLRLLNPWEELSALVADLSEGLDAAESDGGMSDHQHGHVPYVVLLLKYLEAWRIMHGGTNPLSYKEKNDFKVMILDRMRTHVPGGSEENYEEAAAAVLKNVRKAELSSDARKVFEDTRCINPTKDVRSTQISVSAFPPADCILV
jgi:amyloid beta precursor protein binding protein 1